MEPTPGRMMEFQGKKCVQWSINNYLGLADNEEIKQVAIDMAKKYSTSAPMGSRMMTGNTQRHIDVEKEFADYLEKESAILFNYGYLGVLGTISSIVGEDDIILIDKLAHASMIDATWLARGDYRVFKHNDMDDLESQLKKAGQNQKGGVLIVTEGVFGMEGDLANLPDICTLKEKYNARLFVDDAHGFGVMGENGQGVGSYYGIQDKIDIYLGTFAKAFAAIGGVAGSTKPVIDWIRYNARTQVFAKSLPMIYVEVLAKTLEIIQKDKERRQKMWDNSNKLKTGLKGLGYTVGDVPSPITPVYVHYNDMPIAMKLVTMLRDELGIFITGVIYPVVPKDIILFRMIPTASHTDEDISKTVDAFKKVRDTLKLDLDSVKSALSQNKR
jgi:glycine C-acetyltransferase